MPGSAFRRERAEASAGWVWDRAHLCSASRPAGCRGQSWGHGGAEPVPCAPTGSHRFPTGSCVFRPQGWGPLGVPAFESHSAHFTLCAVPAGARPPAEAAFSRARPPATGHRPFHLGWATGRRSRRQPLGWETEMETVSCRGGASPAGARGRRWPALRAGVQVQGARGRAQWAGCCALCTESCVSHFRFFLKSLDSVCSAGPSPHSSHLQVVSPCPSHSPLSCSTGPAGLGTYLCASICKGDKALQLSALTTVHGHGSQLRP